MEAMEDDAFELPDLPDMLPKRKPEKEEQKVPSKSQNGPMKTLDYFWNLARKTKVEKSKEEEELPDFGVSDAEIEKKARVAAAKKQKVPDVGVSAVAATKKGKVAAAKKQEVPDVGVSAVAATKKGKVAPAKKQEVPDVGVSAVATTKNAKVAPATKPEGRRRSARLSSIVNGDSSSSSPKSSNSKSLSQSNQDKAIKTPGAKENKSVQGTSASPLIECIDVTKNTVECIDVTKNTVECIDVTKNTVECIDVTKNIVPITDIQILGERANKPVQGTSASAQMKAIVDSHIIQREQVKILGGIENKPQGLSKNSTSSSPPVPVVANGNASQGFQNKALNKAPYSGGRRRYNKKNDRLDITASRYSVFLWYLKGVERYVYSTNYKENMRCPMHNELSNPIMMCRLCGWPINIISAFTNVQIQKMMMDSCNGSNMKMQDLVIAPFKMGVSELYFWMSQGNGFASNYGFANSYGFANNFSYPQMGMQVNPLMMAQPPQEEDMEEDEDMGVAETYADYMPSKLKVGIKHPDQVVETASMSSVEPPDVWYEMDIPDSTIDPGKLSALQLESITYACQQHEHELPDGSRAGFLIGDGAGVGKGRTIGGIIYENYLKGRKKSIWVSVSNDLKYDAERDLKDIGAGHIHVHFLSKMKYGKINSDLNGNVKKGVLFSTYSSLIGKSSSGQGKYKTRLKQILNWCGDDFDGCIVFDECHRAKNLCPVGSGKPTKTGMTVLELQNRLPKARVVYASATGASEPKNMAYMVRLGIWGKGTPFPEFTDFISAVEKRGVGAMEIVAMDMKLRGMYIARQLSFHGVGFRIGEVPLDEDIKYVYDESVKLWVSARQKFQEASELINAEKGMKKSMWGQFWSSHQRFFKYLCIASKVDHAVRLAREAVKTNRCVVIGLQSTGEARTLEQLEKEDGELSDFVSTAKGVFESLVEKHFPAPDRNRINKILGISETSKEFKEIIDEVTGKSAKRKPVRQAAQRAAKKKYKETHSDNEDDSDFEMSGESGQEEEDDAYSSEASSDFSAMSDFDDEDTWGRPKKRGKPKNHKQKNGKRKAENGEKLPPPPRDHVEKANRYKTELLKEIDNLGRKLPPNTLDQLIDELGGPENVAEMTGRKGRVVQGDDGQVQYESRSEVDVSLEILNIKEKERFMNSEKDIAIISEAASSGISLQSDRRVKNQRRRVHITLELPWSADRAIQQFGRTHRSNQVNAPEYVFLISELAGERRFASIVAKRLESLGALTHGDRRATESRDLSSFNIDTKYGRMALESTMKTMMGYEHPIVPPPEDYKGDFFSDIQNALVGVGIIAKEDSIYQLDKDYNNMSKFLNRILGMPVELQNRLFQYFTDTLAAIVSQAKRTGKYDMGILDLGISGEGCKKTKTKTWVGKHATGTAKTEIHNVLVERGLSWAEIQEKYADLTGDQEGFYISHQVRNNKKTSILAVMEPSAGNKKKEKNARMYIVYRPNTGMQMKQEPFSDLKKKYKKVTPDEAQEHWEEQYKASSHTCSHAYWQGNCRRVNSGLECEIGLRRRTYHVLCGLVLNVWAKVEDVLSSSPHSSSKMQVVRLKTSEGKRLVGTLIPNNLVERLSAVLEEESTESFEETYTDEDSKDSKVSTPASEEKE